jgi:hypothetical protein
MPSADAPLRSTLLDEDLERAVRYLLQLVVEWSVDGALYEGGAEILRSVVTTLNEHRARREALKRQAQLVELVGPITQRLTEEAGRSLHPARTLEAISKWLARRNIALTPAQVSMLLRQPIRGGARARSLREQVLDRLGSLAGSSQSDFEKLLTVIESHKDKPGKLGNSLLHERAARDRTPPTAMLIAVTFDALGIDEGTGQKIVGLLPPAYIEDYMEECVALAELLKAGLQLKRDGRRKIKDVKSHDSGTPSASPATTDHHRPAARATVVMGPRASRQVGRKKGVRGTK